MSNDEYVQKNPTFLFRDLLTSNHIQVSRSMAKQLHIRGAFKERQNISLLLFFFLIFKITLYSLINQCCLQVTKSMTLAPPPPFEINFVLWATLNLMNGPLPCFKVKGWGQGQRSRSRSWVRVTGQGQIYGAKWSIY